MFDPLSESALAEEEGEVKCCFLCQNLGPEVPSPDFNCSLMNKNLEIIFLARQLLEIPSYLCSLYLQKYGDPSDWGIFLCGTCAKLFVTEGRDLFARIKKLEDELKNLRARAQCQVKVKRERGLIPEEAASKEIRQYCLDNESEEMENGCPSPMEFEIQPDLDFENVSPCPQQEEWVDLKIKCEDPIVPKRGRGRPRKNGLQQKKEVEDKKSQELTRLGQVQNDLSSRQRQKPAVYEDVEQCRKKSRNIPEPQSPLVKEESSDLEDFAATSEGEQSDKEDNNYTPSASPTSLNDEESDSGEIRKDLEEAVASSSTQALVIKQKKKYLKKRKTKPNLNRQKNHRAKQKAWRKTPLIPCSKPDCPEHFETKSELSKHYDKLHKIGITCPDPSCEKSVVTADTLENHMRAYHISKNARVCQGCEVKFFEIAKYRTHLRAVDVSAKCLESAVSCPHCPSKAETQEALDVHIKVFHIMPAFLPYKCDDCGKRFPIFHRLLSHQITHSKERPFTCEICGKSFKFDYYLRTHRDQVHLKKEYFFCRVDACGKKFRSMGHRGRHEKTHSKESPWLCTICGKSFKMRDYLNIHVWSHDPDRKLKYSSYKPRKRRKKTNEEVSAPIEDVQINIPQSSSATITAPEDNSIVDPNDYNVNFFPLL